jgi:hypothetical protein
LARFDPVTVTYTVTSDRGRADVLDAPGVRRRSPLVTVTYRDLRP